MNIKAVILDVDGVIVGTKKDINFPHPSAHITDLLRMINETTPVSLLTGKASFMVQKAMVQLGIDTFHVSDGGARIWNPMTNEVAYEAILDKESVRSIIKQLDNYHIAYALYGTKDYYTFAQYKDDPIITRYAPIAGKMPQIISSIDDIDDVIIKMNTFGIDKQQDEQLRQIAVEYEDITSSSVGSHPVMLPQHIRVFVAKGVSKYSGFLHLLKQRNVSKEDVLGVGDTIHDWEFIEHCGYKGIMGNATQQLIEKYNKEDPHQHIGGHVNDDGIIDIFKYFKLIS